MGERIVNLDAVERPVVTVTIGGRAFSIRRVVTGVRQLWSAFVVEQMTCLKHVGEAEKEIATIEKEGSGDAVEEVQRIVEAITLEADSFSTRKIDMLLQVIELLLTKNGYPFDREWWLANADEGNYRDFIMAVLTRDGEETEKKKPVSAAGSPTGGGLPSSSDVTGPGSPQSVSSTT